MNKKELIERIIDDDNIKLQTIEELQDLLDTEVSKSNPDYDLVNELSLSIIEARGQKPLNINTDEKFREIQKIREKKHKFHIPKWVIGLSAACLLLTFGNIFTVCAFDMNMFSFVVEITKGGALIDFRGKRDEDEIVLPTSEDDPYGIIALCKENGIMTETPHYIPNGFILTHMGQNNDNNERYVSLTYKNGEQKIHFTFEKYYGNKFGIPSDEHDLSEIDICGHKGIISREDNQMIVVFNSGEFICSIMTENVDYSECDKILEEMR